jgi:hypothetical protein
VEAQAKDHRDKVLQDARDFEAAQADIDARLLDVTHSQAADDAVERFEASMARLRNIDLAAGYVEMLLEVDRLRFVNNISSQRASVVRVLVLT